jgi:hypothetical protein
MNYHSDEWIMERVREHYNEAFEYFPEDRIVGIFYQGSGNYGLDTPTSDVDTKLIITPTFHDLAMNKQPVSTTHVRANNEHIDFKDVRLYIQTFRKMNLNFLEILFTPYFIINPIYKEEWNRLVDQREAIGRYNLKYGIKAMQGVAYTKYKQLENDSPSHLEAIAKFGYSPKELHHLLRIEDFIGRYIDGEPYGSCMIASNPEYLKSVKNGLYSLDDARKKAKIFIGSIDQMCEDFLATFESSVNEKVDELLNDVQYNIMKIAIEKEIGD